MKIELITKDWLLKLETLLSESFGEPTSIDDELEYFYKTNPQDWFIAVDEENIPLGFIRYFSILGSNNIEIELFAKNNLDVEIALVKEFDGIIKDKVVRFCLNKSKNELINYLTEIGYTHKIEEFQVYTYSDKKEISNNSSVRFAINNPKDIEQIIDVLKEFQELSVSEVINFIDEKKLIVCEKNQLIIGVALNDINEDIIEIIELTIKNEFRGNGFGKELLEGIIANYHDKNITLKVNKENTSAIRLYEKSGFHQELEKDELWINKIYK